MCEPWSTLYADWNITLNIEIISLILEFETYYMYKAYNGKISYIIKICQRYPLP